MPSSFIWPTSTTGTSGKTVDAADALGVDVDTFAGGSLGLDPLFGLISGVEAVAQVAARRLMTPRGLLSDAPDVGIDLRLYLNEVIDDAKLAEIHAAVVQEVTGDERVLTASADVTFDDTAQSLTITVQGATADGPFSFVLLVTSMTVDLLQTE